MGINYSIDLYFPIEHLELALLETVKIATPNRPPIENVTVILLDGRKFNVPFTSHFNSERIHLKMNSGEFQFDTTLLFPIDDAIQNYGNKYPPEHRDKFYIEVNGSKFASIGYIYLYLHIGSKFVRFRYWAATSDMSRLFLESQSIRKRFLDVVNAAKGIAGLIFTESDEYPLLIDSQQKIYFDEMLYLVNEEYFRNGYVDIDRLVETIKILLPK
jgi:hypothetical protein